MVVNAIIIMKKYLRILLAMSVISLLSSCVGDKSQNNDTILNDSTANEKSEEQIVFESPDLRWKDLSGHVKRCVIKRFSAFKRDSVYVAKSVDPESYDTIYFNRKGQVERIVMWTNFDGEDLLIQNTTLVYDDNGECVEGYDLLSHDEALNVSLGRNEEGYITSLLRLRPDDDVVVFGDEVEWTDNRISKYTYIEYDMSSTWQRKYNPEGQLIEEQSLYVSVEEGGESNLKYGYVAVDSFGNWTERYIINEYVNIDYNVETGRETRMTQPLTYFVERREIEYFDEKSEQ